MQYKKTGDLGLVAAGLTGRQTTLARPRPLTVGGVFASLQACAAVQGKDSVKVLCIPSKPLRLLTKPLCQCRRVLRCRGRTGSRCGARYFCTYFTGFASTKVQILTQGKGSVKVWREIICSMFLHC